MGPKLCPKLQPKMKVITEEEYQLTVNGIEVPKQMEDIKETKEREDENANVPLELSAFISETSLPKMQSEAHQKSRPTLAIQILGQDAQDTSNQIVYRTPQKPKRSFKKCPTPQPTMNTLPDMNDGLVFKKKMLFSKQKESFQTGSQGNDSDVLSEHSDEKIPRVNKFTLFGKSKKFAKPKEYFLPQPELARNQESVKTQHRAKLPQRKNMNFTLQSSPFDDEDQEHHKKHMPITGTNLFQIKLEKQTQQPLKSLMTWQSEDIIQGYEQEMKSVPFSQLLGQDAESHVNLMQEASNLKSDFLLTTPKNFQYWTKSINQTKGLNQTQNFKSSIFLEELFQEEEIVEQLTKYVNNTENMHKLTQYTQDNAHYFRQIEDAKHKGRAIAQSLQVKETPRTHFQFSEGLHIIEEQDLEFDQSASLNKVSGCGTKILICSERSCVLRNLQSRQLEISALQMEMENQLEKQERAQVLVEILQEEEEECEISKEQKTKTITFVDCSFIQDVSQYLLQPLDYYSCQVAFSIQNKSKNVILNVNFVNCVISGFHHAFNIIGKHNICVNFENTTMKKQLFQTIFFKDPLWFGLTNCQIKKSNKLGRRNMFAVQVQLTKWHSAQTQQKFSQISVEKTVFQKIHGCGLLVYGSQDEFQNCGIAIADSQFSQIQGQSALTLLNIQNMFQNRHQAKDFEEADFWVHSRIKQSPFQIHIQNCEFKKNKKNGIQLLNILNRFLFRRVTVEDNQDTGVVVNEQFTEGYRYQERCSCFEQQIQDTEMLNQTFDNGLREVKQLTHEFRPQNLIQDSHFCVNQNNGLQLTNLSRTDITITKNHFENNFCDGIFVTSDKPVSAEKGLSPMRQEDSRYRSLARKNGNRIKIVENFFVTNKTNGITLQRLPKDCLVSVLKNEFNSNINKDVEVNDYHSFLRAFVPLDNQDKANKMDYSIGKNFNEEEEKGEEDLSLRNSFENGGRGNGENLRENQKDFRINKHNIMSNQKNGQNFGKKTSCVKCFNFSKSSTKYSITKESTNSNHGSPGESQRYGKSSSSQPLMDKEAPEVPKKGRGCSIF